MTIIRQFGAVLASFVICTAVYSQDSQIVKVTTINDWTVYKSTAGDSECGIISKPMTTINRRNGKVADVRRGEIYLSITVLPQKDDRQLVAFQAGYPLEEGSTVKLSIDGNIFDLYPGTENNRVEWAWPLVGQDNRIINMLKNGRTAVITGTSRRGTKTEDTFSLLGVTNGLKEAETCVSNL